MGCSEEGTEPAALVDLQPHPALALLQGLHTNLDAEGGESERRKLEGEINGRKKRKVNPHTDLGEKLKTPGPDSYGTRQFFKNKWILKVKQHVPATLLTIRIPPPFSSWPRATPGKHAWGPFLRQPR